MLIRELCLRRPSTAIERSIISCLTIRLKSAKQNRKSYTTNNQKGTIAIIGNSIKLPKVGSVKAVIYKNPEADWIIKSATFLILASSN